MDRERPLKAELRRALDDVLPPVPWLEAAVSEDLRKRRSGKSVDRTPHTQQRPKAFFRPAMELVAGALILVLAAATVVTFLAMHYLVPQSAPAGRISVEAYQRMVSRDDGLLNVARDKGCNDIQSACPASPRPLTTALQRWLDDLSTSEAPARFAVIDAQMRRHLAATISDVNAVFAAYRAQDQDGLDRANQAGGNQQGWLDGAAGSIADSRPGTVATYISSVQVAYQDFGGCAACRSLVDQVDCTGMQTTSCEYDLIYATWEIELLQFAPVSVTAPSSLAAQDASLQNDLAQADTGVLTMSTARVTGDQAAFEGGRLLLQQALSALKADADAILGG